MPVRSIVYVAGIVVSLIAALFIFYAHALIASQTIASLAGLAILGYYILFSYIGALLVVAGKPPVTGKIGIVPILIALFQFVSIISLLQASGKFDIGWIIILIPPLLLIVKGAADLSK